MLPFTSHAQFKPSQGPSPISSDAGAPKSIVFPHCQIDHGICASLLGSLPFAIVGVQFVRNGVDAVQDAVVIFNNTRAEALFAAQDSRTLKGAMFLTTFGNILPFGLWQRLLWVAACGRSEIIDLPPRQGGIAEILVAAPYQDGLILSMSITESARV